MMAGKAKQTAKGFCRKHACHEKLVQYLFFLPYKVAWFNILWRLNIINREHEPILVMKNESKEWCAYNIMHKHWAVKRKHLGHFSIPSRVYTWHQWHVILNKLSVRNSFLAAHSSIDKKVTDKGFWCNENKETYFTYSCTEVLLSRKQIPLFELQRYSIQGNWCA